MCNNLNYFLFPSSVAQAGGSSVVKLQFYLLTTSHPPFFLFLFIFCAAVPFGKNLFRCRPERKRSGGSGVGDEWSLKNPLQEGLTLAREGRSNCRFYLFLIKEHGKCNVLGRMEEFLVCAEHLVYKTDKFAALCFFSYTAGINKLTFFFLWLFECKLTYLPCLLGQG